MSIARLTQDQFQAILRENLTPSATIKTPERLYGRERALQQIERAIASQGRQVFVYGDRGVGKTSVGLTAAHLLNSAGEEPIYVVCGQEDTFANIMVGIGNAVVGVSERIEQSGRSAEIGGTLLGFGATYKPGERGKTAITAPSSLNEALDILRYILTKRRGRVVIVVDEMERIQRSEEREKFAELIKNVPEVDDRVKFIFCGIANTVDELLGSHPSAGRILETIHLERLHHNFLWEIIEVVASKTGIVVEREALIRISQISDGFPHYVHLIGESMFWSAFDDAETVERIRPKHFKDGIAGALQRTEAVLRQQYAKATMKTKNTEDYEEALWALGDRTNDQRQLSEIYDTSYKRLMALRTGRPLLPRDKFNQRMLALRKESHGRIVVGHGSGWFGFRENIMRGYVRLRAEEQGIELGRDGSMGV